MRTIIDIIENGVVCLAKGIGWILGFGCEEEGNDMNVRLEKTAVYNGVANTSVTVSDNILDEFRKTVGKCRPETGGMLACSNDMNIIDTWCFDRKSVNTSASYSYDVQEMSEQFKKWKENNIRSVGFVHSHPSSYRHPSYDDIATARALMKFFKNDFFYLPIIISNKKGFFTMYFFVVRQVGLHLNVNLDYVQKATADGYESIPFRHWEENYIIKDVEEYYNRVNGGEDEPESIDAGVAKTISDRLVARPVYTQGNKPIDTKPFAPTYALARPISYYGMPYGRVIIKEDQMKKTETPHAKQAVNNTDYFKRLEGVYPEKVLDKVIVCVGTGGARTVLENMARNGFHNFILIDGDKISPSNIATQGVFISEMGMWKTEAIRVRINDINPDANVICVNRFLNDDFTDDEFRECLRNFQGKVSTDYLVLGCCDTFEGNRRSSELSLKYGLPYIGAGMYQQGLAAEVIFTYPGVTPSCPRCMLRSRYEAYEEEGYKNDVTSAGCPTFATERLNTLIGFISIMILMHGDAPESPYNKMLDEVKDRNFVWIRMSPYLSKSELGIGIFDRVFGAPDTSKYTFMDEALWIPQHPDSPEFGEKPCKLCGGVGDLRRLKYKWADTRKIEYR